MNDYKDSMQNSLKLGFFIQPVHPLSRFYGDVLREDREAVVLADQPDSELSTKRCIERLVIAGTPQSVADQILAFRNEVGAFGTLLYTGHDWTDPALARRSMELMANEVWTRIDQAAHGTTPKGQTDGKAFSV
ncbi:hypothetical protein [Nostoc punctiforme]|uniref:hypothetical protein n=1 Tax=Nostoc punctiforme TaxID=272131 RepID=UPI0003260C19|nr:hypothetical protein [Nostoc punctiforme]